MTVTKLTVNKTKFVFKFVPSEVPDDEILNLCSFYGKVEGGIERQNVEVPTKDGGNIKITSATRYVHIKLFPGKKFKTYYWLEGPLPDNRGRRITVYTTINHNSVPSA